MNRADWILVVAAAVMFEVALLTTVYYGFTDPLPHTCPVSIPTTPSTGPVSVEWTHGDGKVTIHLGGAGFPIVADPGSGRKWLLIPVKTDPKP